MWFAERASAIIGACMEQVGLREPRWGYLQLLWPERKI